MAQTTGNTVDQTYFVKPGESTAQYNARIATYNQTKATTPAQGAMNSAIGQTTGSTVLTGSSPLVTSSNIQKNSVNSGANFNTTSPTQTYTPAQQTATILNTNAPTQAPSQGAGTTYNPATTNLSQAVAAQPATGLVTNLNQGNTGSTGSTTGSTGNTGGTTQSFSAYGQTIQPGTTPTLDAASGNIYWRNADGSYVYDTPGSDLVKQYAPQYYKAGNQNLGSSITNAQNQVNSNAPASGQTSGYIQNLAGATANNPLTSGPIFDAYTQAVNDLNALKQSVSERNAALASSPQAASFKFGTSAANQQADASKLQAAQDRVNAAQVAMNQALTEQQQQQAGYSSAAGASNTQQATTQTGNAGLISALQPVQVPYSNQFVSPTTGQAVGSATGGGGTSAGPSSSTGGAGNNTLQGAVSSVAAKIANGSMGYTDGAKELSAYGVAGTNALRQALGANFDTVASDANATARTASTVQTGTVGGQLTKAQSSATAALDKLVTDFGNLSKYQTQGIPITNDIAQTLSSWFGSNSVSAYQTTLQDARAQLSGVLTAAGAVTPSGADAMAKSYLPDGMTPGQLQEKVATAKALIQQKVTAFTTAPGNTGGNTPVNPSIGGSSLFNF